MFTGKLCSNAQRELRYLIQATLASTARVASWRSRVGPPTSPPNSKSAFLLRGTYVLSGSGLLTTTDGEGIGVDGGTGIFQQSGGTNNVFRGLGLGSSFGSSGSYTLSGSGVLVVSGGELIGYSGTASFVQSGGINNVISGQPGMNVATAAASSGSYTLGGGTLICSWVIGGLGASTFNFNGGLLQAASGGSCYVGGLTAAYVQSGGANIDTNCGYITIPQSLLDAGGGGGLTKYGSGTLTLTGTNTYTGGTTINAGVLSFTNLSLGMTGSIAVADGSTLDGSLATSTMFPPVWSWAGRRTGHLDTNGNNLVFARAIRGAGGAVSIGAGANLYPIERLRWGN